MDKYLNTNAHISRNGDYRYTLMRQWDWSDKVVTFIGLNPSTADATQDDPTIRRCVGYARDWGYGCLYMVNLFAYRSTDPLQLQLARDPVGPLNDKTILEVVGRSQLVVAAWGNHGIYMNRDLKVRELLKGKLHALKVSKIGQPGHPLYLKKTLKPIFWG
jgi:hypothetical protein